MTDIQVPLELVSNFLSIIILTMILLKFYQYKKKMNVLKELEKIKEQKKLTAEDKSFITSNFNDYKYKMQRNEQQLKLIYPVFILVAGIIFAFLPFKEALIHLNVVVVAYIFLQATKIHTRNFATLLQELNKEL